MAKQLWYVVIVGKRTGVFDTWIEAGPLTKVKHSIYQSFDDEAKAHRVYAQAERDGTVEVVGGHSAGSSNNGVSRAQSEPQVGRPRVQAPLRSNSGLESASAPIPQSSTHAPRSSRSSRAVQTARQPPRSPAALALPPASLFREAERTPRPSRRHLAPLTRSPSLSPPPTDQTCHDVTDTDVEGDPPVFDGSLHSDSEAESYPPLDRFRHVDTRPRGSARLSSRRSSSHSGRSSIGEDGYETCPEASDSDVPAVNNPVRKSRTWDSSILHRSSRSGRSQDLTSQVQDSPIRPPVSSPRVAPRREIANANSSLQVHLVPPPMQALGQSTFRSGNAPVARLSPPQIPSSVPQPPSLRGSPAPRTHGSSISLRASPTSTSSSGPTEVTQYNTLSPLRSPNLRMPDIASMSLVPGGEEDRTSAATPHAREVSRASTSRQSLPYSATDEAVQKLRQAFDNAKRLSNNGASASQTHRESIDAEYNRAGDNEHTEGGEVCHAWVVCSSCNGQNRCRARAPSSRV
ncbi:hypothetical protein HGRIS_002137 [Hohenbuehelia grisea]|uniref:Ribonuclease H1 N-terminal domain-containing protein n=1 Tax=Hohenbuehelia grisea TaxID=104357 RepID=A0ABR3JJL1_9AGAR